jgi:hypothetical protein
MREFPPISKEIENEALQTIFFTDGEFEGRPCRVRKINYLATLSLRGPEVAKEVEKLRVELTLHPLGLLESDIGRLYAARNWRVHLMACVAVAAGFATESTIRALWGCLSLGSWVSPQLASTAAFIDTDFAEKASSLVADHGTYYKSTVALSAILAEEFKVVPLEGSAAERNVIEASEIDSDNSGGIALGWLANLRNTFGSVYESNISR